MNGCQNLELAFNNGGYFNTSCNFVASGGRYYNLSYFVNVSDLTYDVIREGGNGRFLTACKYDYNYNLIENLSWKAEDIGSHTLQLDPNYLYRFSYNGTYIDNVKGFNCNVGVGSMSKELAFGSGNNLFSSVSTLAPLFVAIIGFALGFWFLKNIVRKGQKGKTL